MNPDPGPCGNSCAKSPVSPAIARRKVGIIYEADRMNEATSNAFLKTLEEPPGLTTLLLLTTRPTRCCRRSAAAACISVSPRPPRRSRTRPCPAGKPIIRPGWDG